MSKCDDLFYRRSERSNLSQTLVRHYVQVGFYLLVQQNKFSIQRDMDLKWKIHFFIEKNNRTIVSCMCTAMFMNWELFMRMKDAFRIIGEKRIFV